MSEQSYVCACGKMVTRDTDHHVRDVDTWRMHKCAPISAAHAEPLTDLDVIRCSCCDQPIPDAGDVWCIDCLHDETSHALKFQAEVWRAALATQQRRAEKAEAERDAVQRAFDHHMRTPQHQMAPAEPLCQCGHSKAAHTAGYDGECCDHDHGNWICTHYQPTPAEPLTDYEQDYPYESIEHLRAELAETRAQLATQQAEDEKIRALCRDAGMTDESTTLDYLRGVFYMLKKLATQQAALRELMRSRNEIGDDFASAAQPSIGATTASGWLHKCADELARLLGEPGETR